MYQLFFKRKKKKFRGVFTILICSIGLCLGVQWAYNNVLQNHQNVVIVLDSLAASELKLYDYYIHTEKMYLKFMC